MIAIIYYGLVHHYGVVTRGPGEARIRLNEGSHVHHVGSSALTLYGRAHELRRLDDLIGQLNDRGATLVLSGEAGIGKSALLATAQMRAHAHGFRSLNVVGTPSETHIPFAGLHQLLRPLLSEGASDLPTPQHDALLTAFGMATAAHAPDLFLVALATLELLSANAACAPLIVLVDDAQWLDRSSRDALAFVARRLETRPILLLMAFRDEFDSDFTASGLPQAHLERLDEASAEALLDASAPRLASGVRKRILEEALGNPLALVELPAVNALHSISSAPLPSLLPLTTRLEHTFAARVTDLPDATRTLLLVAAAADDSGDPAMSLTEIQTASALIAGGAQLTSAAFEPAIIARLVTLDKRQLQFRHPLMRSAIYQAASDAQRRTAHAALAQALADQPDRSVWHRAASLEGPDAVVASELEAAATRARRRGDLAAACAALERSAQHTSDPQLRGMRLLYAAEAAFKLGQHDLGLRLLRSAERLPLQPQERTRLAWLKEVYELRNVWSGAASVASFVAIADQARLAGDVELALNALLTLAVRYWWANPDADLRAAVVEAAKRVNVGALNPALLTILAHAAPIEQGASVLERLAQLPAEGNDDPATTFMLASAASAVGDYHLAARWLASATTGLRMRGQLGVLAQALVTQAWATFYLGNWAVALPAAAEATQLAEETGQAHWAAAAQLASGALAAYRGELIQAEARANSAERVFLPMAANPMLAEVQVVRGLAALCDGRYAIAYECLRRIFDPSDVAYHPLVRCWVIGDLAEAAIHSGHQDEARRLMDALEQLAAQAHSPLLQAALTCARPLLAADTTQAETLFQAASGGALGQWPLHHARVQLAYGAWLRRRRRVTDARPHLRTAMEAFDALSALPWSELARKELRAAGENSRRREPSARDSLSPQEMQIAQLAAQGLSNRAIGQHLYLSHRTIGWHLHRIFPKLGITTRAELHTALGDTE